MKYANKMSQYLETVCEQIRWAKAHPIISKEIEDHIIDQKNAFIESGLNEEVAIEKAIEEMGDPVEVGVQFDRVYKPRVEWNIIALTSILVLIGLFAKAWVSRGGNMPPFLTKTIISMLLGISCMIGAYFFDFTILGKYPRVIYFSMLGIGSIIMLIAPIVNGRTLYAYNILLLLPIAFAGIVYKMRTKGYKGIILSGVYFVLPLCIAPFMSNTSAFVLYIACGMLLMTIAILKGWFGVNKIKGILLISPLTLPFVSYGNVATVINMTLIGVMLSLFNTGRLLKGDAVKGTKKSI